MIYAVPKKIAIISPPFVGHYRILFNLAARLIASDNNIHITFIITGWTHVSLSDLERKKFDISRMTLIEMDGGIFQRPAPFYFTFPRVTNLIERVIKACEDHMYIIYDTFSLEGYIAGQILGIPAICSVTGVMGPFDSRLPLFSQAITDNGPIINQLEDTYKISLLERIQMLGDGYFIASDYQTIQWSWPKLIEIDDYSCNRSLVNNQFMRPLNNRTCAVRSLEEKIIYFSLGTVVTTHLWSHSQSLQRFVRKILESIVEKFDGRHGYRVIISAGRKVSDLFTTIPRNFLVSESLPQLDILSQSNLFITHGGGNSVNEAIDAGVPMIVIPFLVISTKVLQMYKS